MYLVRENINDRIKQEFNEILNENLSFQFHMLLEKAIRTDSKLLSKLDNIRVSNSSIVQDLSNFLESDGIRDTANVEKLIYNIENPTLFGLEYTDKMGNKKMGQQKFTRALDYLGFDLSKYTSREIQDLVNFFKKGELDNFKLLSGEDIVWGYNRYNYDSVQKSSDNATMGSCMSHPDCADFFDIYVKNPNEVQLLVLMNPVTEKVRGRTLIWTMSDGNKYMDRIYLIDSAEEYLFHFYAEQHNITEKLSAPVKLSMGRQEYGDYPYMDTFKYYDPIAGILYTGYLAPKPQPVPLYYLNGTEGNDYERLGEVYSRYYDEYVPENEAVYARDLEDFIYSNDAEFSKYHDGYILADNAISVNVGSYEGEFFKESDMYDGTLVKLTGTDWYAYHADVCTTYNGNNELKSDCVMLTYGNYEYDWALRDEVTRDYHYRRILKSEAVKITEGAFEGYLTWDKDPRIVISGNSVRII